MAVETDRRSFLGKLGLIALGAASFEGLRRIAKEDEARPTNIDNERELAARLNRYPNIRDLYGKAFDIVLNPSILSPSVITPELWRVTLRGAKHLDAGLPNERFEFDVHMHHGEKDNAGNIRMRDLRIDDASTILTATVRINKKSKNPISVKFDAASPLSTTIASTYFSMTLEATLDGLEKANATARQRKLTL